MKKYRLVEENELRRLIEGNMIYDELCAWGVDNWVGYDFVKFPDIDDIEEKVKGYDYVLQVTDANKELHKAGDS